jgi:glyoxalase family protein
MTEKLISGLHHVTALSSDARKNLDFYAGILGLRLVKKTINFDSPDVYHLYYGDYEGSPGALMTFFPYQGISSGRKGTGQVITTSFSVPENSLGYWMKRLDRFDIIYTSPEQRFESEEFIYFEDDDGLGIELVASNLDSRQEFDRGLIKPEYGIKGFFGVTISLQNHDNTAMLLTESMDHELVSEFKGRYRVSPLRNSDRPGGAGTFVDLVSQPAGTKGAGGGGTIHHVAFATDNKESQLMIRKRLIGAGLQVTPVIDRQYFQSVYFREPGGVLFEIATMPPGMTIDEDIGNLGMDLKLPPWYEEDRSEIERRLGGIYLEIEKFRD